MFKIIDRIIENAIKKHLHKKREKIISDALKSFQIAHPSLPTDDILKKMNAEGDRIYAIVDRSILRERIQRAKFTFWITAIVGVTITGLLGAFTGGSAIPFIAPCASALLGWLISIATIPISYNQRVKGAMDSVLISHESTLKESHSAQKLENSQTLHMLTRFSQSSPLVINNDVKHETPISKLHHLEKKPSIQDDCYVLLEAEGSHQMRRAR